MTKHVAMKTPPIVSRQEWEAEREKILVKEKATMRARDALSAERRRMPWMEVDKAYVFEGPNGKASLLDLFEGRRQRQPCRGDQRVHSNPVTLVTPTSAGHGLT